MNLHGQGRFHEHATVGGLRDSRDLLLKLLCKEKQRNGDLRKEIEKLRATKQPNEFQSRMKTAE